MSTSEVGILSAIVSILTLVISKLVELATTKMKLGSEVDAKRREFYFKREAQDYGEFKESLKEEVAKLKSELSEVRDNSITLRVENARLTLINEQLEATIKELTEAQKILEEEIAKLKKTNPVPLVNTAKISK